MKKRQKIVLEIVVFVCAIIAVITSEFPLMEGNSQALVLQLLFGSFGAGIILARLINDA